MKLRLSTVVQQDVESVKNGFNETLFRNLNPPFPRVSVKRFDGCRTGDMVELELNFGLFKQTWVSDIIADKESDEEWGFVDRGLRLPFFMKRWYHQHLVQARGQHSVIIDDIHFYTGTVLTDVLVYPLIWFQFIFRKPIYRYRFSDRMEKERLARTPRYSSTS